MKLSLHPQRIATLFDRLAETYDGPAARFFPFCADRMAYRFPPDRNSKVLDIATGTGALALSLAQAMGQGEGRVIGIDISAGMLDMAYRNLRRLALKNVDLHEMDASHLIFRADYFDTVYCAFGLFFIEDMEAALVSWRKVTRPQGRLVLSSFAQQAFQPMLGLLCTRLAAHGVAVMDKEGGYAGYRLADGDHCKALLQSAGWTQVEVHEEQCGYHLMAFNDWWDLLWNTSFRAYLEQLTEKDLEAVKLAHLAEIEPLMKDEGLWVDLPINFISAINPNE